MSGLKRGDLAAFAMHAPDLFAAAMGAFLDRVRADLAASIVGPAPKPRRKIRRSSNRDVAETVRAGVDRPVAQRAKRPPQPTRPQSSGTAREAPTKPDQAADKAGVSNSLTSGHLGLAIDVTRGELARAGSTTILAGMPLRLVAAVVEASSSDGGAVERAVLINKLWGYPRPASADAMLSQQQTVANARLRGLGLELRTFRGVGIALQQREEP